MEKKIKYWFVLAYNIPKLVRAEFEVYTFQHLSNTTFAQKIVQLKIVLLRDIP